MYLIKLEFRKLFDHSNNNGSVYFDMENIERVSDSLEQRATTIAD